MKQFVFIFSILLLVSCGKKRTVHGRVYNPVTGNGIAGMGVYVMKQKFCIGGCADKAVESTTTDANGNYSMEYRDKGGLSLLFDNDLDEFSSMNSNIPGISGNQEYDLLLVTKGHLQRTITNINCFDSSDEFIRTSYTHEYVTELNSYVISSYSGCFNQTYSNNLVPMGWYFWEGTVTKNNITTPFVDSIYVPEGGSVQWSIEY